MQTPSQTSQQVDDLVKKAFRDALQRMVASGYKIPPDVKVRIDPRLPFMGYTMPTPQGFNIVVSGGSVESGMLEGLLMHEMGHIYRIVNEHPSHSAEILEEAVERIGGNLADYEQKIIHDLLNDIQDLYADDLTFNVLRKSPILSGEQMTEFLQSWVKDAPVNTGDPVRDRWTNTSLMAHNARAIAQMKRHDVKDTGGLAAKANQTFLDQVSPDIAGEFGYFRDTLLNLREKMTANEYRKLLADYVDRFVGLAEKG